MTKLGGDAYDRGSCDRSLKDTNGDPVVSATPLSAVSRVYKSVFRTLWSFLIIQSSLKDFQKDLSFRHMSAVFLSASKNSTVQSA